MPSITFRISEELKARIDQERGEVPISIFIRNRLAERYLWPASREVIGDFYYTGSGEVLTDAARVKRTTEAPTKPEINTTSPLASVKLGPEPQKPGQRLKKR